MSEPVQTDPLSCVPLESEQCSSTSGQNHGQELSRQETIEAVVERRLATLENTINERLDAFNVRMLEAVNNGLETMADTVTETVTNRINARFNFLRNDFYELRDHISGHYFDEYIDDPSAYMEDEMEDYEYSDENDEELQEELRELYDDLGHRQRRMDSDNEEETQKGDDKEEQVSHSSCSDSE